MSRSRIGGRLLLGGFISSALALVACVSPEAVHTYAISASAAAGDLSTLADGFYATCVRQAEYEAKQSNMAIVSPDSVASASCRRRQVVVDSLKADTKILTAYFSALAALSSNDFPSYDPAIDSLAAEVQRVPSVGTSKKASALAGIAKFLARALTEGYRRNHLRDAIATQNGNILEVTGALRTAVSAYDEDLANEETSLTIYFGDALQRAQGEPVSILLREAWDSREEVLRTTRQKVASYRKAIDAMAKGHQALYDSRDSLTAKELTKDLLQQAKALDAALAALVRAS